MVSDVTSLHFTNTRVDVFPDSTLITLADGTTVPGAPEDTDDYRATAARLGYGDDTLKLCQEHEVTHIALCDWLGIDSPTMILLHAPEPDDRLRRLNQLEEAAVLAIQHFARAAGIDLVNQMAKTN